MIATAARMIYDAFGAEMPEAAATKMSLHSALASPAKASDRSPALTN